MGMLKEFKEFAMKGSVVDLAIGVIIGGAFGAIVKICQGSPIFKSSFHFIWKLTNMLLIRNFINPNFLTIYWLKY